MTNSLFSKIVVNEDNNSNPLIFLITISISVSEALELISLSQVQSKNIQNKASKCSLNTSSFITNTSSSIILLFSSILFSISS